MGGTGSSRVVLHDYEKSRLKLWLWLWCPWSHYFQEISEGSLRAPVNARGDIYLTLRCLNI